MKGGVDGIFISGRKKIKAVGGGALLKIERSMDVRLKKALRE